MRGATRLLSPFQRAAVPWVRTFLCAYFCEKIGQPFTLEPEKYGGVPQIIYTHDLFEQRTKADRWDKLRGKYLIPQRDRTGRPIILLARDPRDAFVSLYIQLTRRTRETPAKLKQMSASELLRDPAFGIESMVEIMNSWLAEWSDRSGFLLLRYEGLRSDPGPEFRRLLQVLGERPLEERAFFHALEFSDFGHMKKLEGAGAFASKILRAGDTKDPESFKVRRGKIGGFEDYLSPNDQVYAAAALQKLDPRFDYGGGAAGHSGRSTL